MTLELTWASQQGIKQGRPVYRKAGVLWAVLPDRRAPTIQKLSLFIIYRQTRKQVYFMTLNAEASVLYIAERRDMLTYLDEGLL